MRPEPPSTDEPEIVLRPAAKLNLSLEVLGRRADGYHELASVFQAIDLRDTLRILPGENLRLECAAPGLSGEGNLALRAACLLRAEAGVSAGACLRLEKGMPVAAGLGGGSADAAAALVGLARLWNLALPPGRLAELAARLGSDVPFFLGPPTALARGRGDELSPLPPPAAHWAIVVRPAQCQPPPDKTRRLYAALRPEDYRDGAATAALAEDLRAGRPLDPALLTNSFERAARELFPEVAEAEAALLAAGAEWVHLAGSGPCLYTLIPDEPGGIELARSATDFLRVTGRDVYLARTLAR